MQKDTDRESLVNKDASYHTICAWSSHNLVFEKYDYAPGRAEAIPRHFHEEYQICLSLNFAGEYEYRRTRWHIPAGSISIIHPAEVHSARDIAYRNVTAKFIVIYIPPGLVQEIIEQASQKNTSLPFFKNPVILDKRIIALCRRFYESIGHETESIEAELCLSELITSLTLRYADTKIRIKLYQNESDRIKLVREYIHDNYTKNIPLVELASIVNLSPFHLHRLFTKELGFSPHKYLMNVRLMYAKRLLLQNTPAIQTAAETGFADQSHLIRIFKRYMQVSPSRYIVQNSKNVQAFSV